MKKTTTTESKTTATVNTTATEPMNAPASVFDNKEFCSDMKKRADNIKREMGKVESSFLKIAFDLHYIYTNKGFEVLGAKDIYELAKTRFGIARGTANGFINIVDAFAKRDDSGNILPELDDRYKKFTSSQLLVMLNMTEQALLEVNPEMTIREIKKLKKGESDIAEESVEESSEDSGEKSSIKVTEKDVPNRQVMITFSTLEEYEKSIDKLDAMIVRTLKVKKGEQPKYSVEVSMTW